MEAGEVKRNNLFISGLNEKDVDHFTSDIGLFLRRKCDIPYKLIAHEVCGVHVLKPSTTAELSDEEYFNSLSADKIPLSSYDLKAEKHNIIIERYPKLNKGEPYIFVFNHSCPEDIETILNVLDRNAYLVLGSLKTLREESDGYLVWLNGTIPFNISNEQERQTVIPKADRVLETNSILIFTEASHNLGPNKVVNHFFDGPVNMSLNSARKIVVGSLIRDNERNVSFVDINNPIDIRTLNEEMDKRFFYNTEDLPQYEYNKKKIKAMTEVLRDKMATSVMYTLLRHDEMLIREDYRDIEAYLRTLKFYDSIEKLHWTDTDDFDGEFKTKKTEEEMEYEQVITDMANLASSGKDIGFDQSYWLELSEDLSHKDIPRAMEDYVKKLKNVKSSKK